MPQRGLHAGNGFHVRLRRKLGDPPPIETIPRGGYGITR
jgi:hypothetical protein